LVEIRAADWLGEQIYHCLVLGVRAGSSEAVESSATIEWLSWHSELSWRLSWSLPFQQASALGVATE